MESDDVLLSQDFFKTSFQRQDVTTLPSYKLWIEAKKNQGKKIVKCPWCWGYEVFIEPTNHRCPSCDNLYCQKCLQKCVEDEVRHDHNRGCWSKFCGLVDIMIDWGKSENEDITVWEYIYTSLIFVFGNHVLYTIKYYNFFKDNKLIDNDCVHSFFTFMNLLANIFYCIAFNMIFFEFFFLLFFPAIFIKCYFKFIILNWLVVLEFGVDESPITELTVRGRGYSMY